MAAPPSGGGRRGQRPRDLLRAIALDHVADLDVVEVLDADTALEAFAHFLDVVLEAAQRPDGAVEYFHAVADDPDARLTVDDPAAHRAAGDEADLRHLED